MNGGDSHAIGIGHDPNITVPEGSCADYFDLQLRVAAIFAAIGRIPRHDAIQRFTNLRRRFGLMGRGGEAAWETFLRGVLPECGHGELLARCLTLHARRPAPEPSPFGCFSYDPPDAHGVLRIHFMPEPRHRHDSPLSDARRAEREAELRQLIADVRLRYPRAAAFKACRGSISCRPTGVSSRRLMWPRLRLRRLPSI